MSADAHQESRASGDRSPDASGEIADGEHPEPETDQPHPWRRFVAIGDSFTEGVGDPEPTAPNGYRGWADRVAEVLAEVLADSSPGDSAPGDSSPGFAYANLAIRGRLLDQIVAEQIPAALELQPDLVTISAGGNDLIRPGADPDAIAARFERGIERLAASGATVVVFTGVDTRFQPVFSAMRGKIAIYNEHVRAIAARLDAVVADQWSLRSIQHSRMWADDRLHLNAFGHHEVARMVLHVLGVPNALEPMAPAAVRPPKWRQARVRDIEWAREHLVPWVIRRVRHRSSGDGVSPKRPFAEPLFTGSAAAQAEGAPVQVAPAQDASAEATPAEATSAEATSPSQAPSSSESGE